MSDSSAPVGTFKRRRLQGACDYCRKRKVRCDSSQMPGRICSNCKAFNSPCTHQALNKREGLQSGSDPQMISSLISDILSKQGTYQAPQNPVDMHSQLVRLAQYAQYLERQLLAKEGRSISPDADSLSPGYTSDPQPQHPPLQPAVEHNDDASEGATDLSDKLKGMVLTSSQDRFFGKSSHIMLVKDVLDVQGHYQVHPKASGTKRKQFWSLDPWQIQPSVVLPGQEFPSHDLLMELIQLFFTHIQPYVPILHRPSFEKSVASGLHLKDHRFGNVVLSVCAIASRYSNDPRVLVPGTSSEYSCGWQWLGQINFFRRNPSGHLTFQLFDLQALCFSILFYYGTSTQDISWVLLGLGIRSAQELGIHRRRFKQRKPTMEEELWKRVFWMLVCIDVGMCCTLGRPSSMRFNDFDLDMPIECDDEYWEHPDPDLCFGQPADKPSYMTFFVKYIELMEILDFTYRNMYAVKKSWLEPQTSETQGSRHLVIELDSALNKWVDSVPDYLRWDPHKQNKLFLNQSALLYVNYYHTQILLHRSFIPRPGRPSPLGFPSLAICANAARSCSRLVDLQSQRGFLPLPQIQGPVFAAANILLLNIWSGRSSGLSLDPIKEMEDVNKCYNFFRSQEHRWQVAGRLCDIISELVSASNLPLPRVTSLKRRNNDTEGSSAKELSSPSPFPSYTRVGQTTENEIQPPPPAPTAKELDQLFQIPIYASELGQLPIHTSSNILPRTNYHATSIYAPLNPLFSQPLPIGGEDYASEKLDFHCVSDQGLEAFSQDNSIGQPGDGLSPDNAFLWQHSFNSNIDWYNWGGYFASFSEPPH